MLERIDFVMMGQQGGKEKLYQKKYHL